MPLWRMSARCCCCPDRRRGPPLVLSSCRYNRCFEYYKQAQASYWTAEEVDLAQVRA